LGRLAADTDIEEINMKRRRDYDHRLDDEGPDVARDGETVHVRLADGHFRYRHRTTLADQIAQDCALWSGHRPGQVIDNFGPALTMDGAYSTAFAMRDQAFSDLCERSANAWRRPFPDAVGVSGPLSPALNVAGPLPDQPDDNDDDDDDDDDNDRGSGDPLAKAMDARERAYRAQYDQQKWRDPPSIYSNTPNTLTPPNRGERDPNRAAVVEAIRRRTVLR
jgi:hypothetical protein